MTAQTSEWRAPRTMIVGLGTLGQEIVEATARRLSERSVQPPTVAFLTVLAREGTDHDSVPNNRIGAVTLPLANALELSRRHARQAALAAGDRVVGALVDGLSSISRIPQASTFQQASRTSGLAAELAIYVVAALDDPFAGALVLDLAYLCRQLARQRLNASAALTGLLLLPDTLRCDDPRPAQARAYAALCELESTMQPHDGWPARWGENLQVDGWGPPFDGGCFLLGSLNGHGLSLEQPAERVEMTAEALLQLALTPLGARCDSPLPPAWHSGQRSHAYGSLGVAAWVYPERALIDLAARRLAGEMLAAWIGEPLPNDQAQTAGAGSAFLEAHHMTLGDIAEALAPAQSLGAADLCRPLAVPLSLDTARTMRQGMDDEMARRLEPVATARPAMDRQAAELAQTLIRWLADDVALRLDETVAGRLGAAAVYLAAVEQRLAGVLTEMSQAAEDRWRDMERIDRELARVGQRLDALGKCLPEASWSRYFATLVRPRRLWTVIQALREITQLGPAYGALLMRQTALTMEMLSHDLATEVFRSAQLGVARQQQRIDSLRAGATAAQQQVVQPQASLCGALGFGLEQSVLTPEIVEDLYQATAGAISDVLAEFARTPDRLSDWPAADPDGEDLAGVCLDFARRRCQALDTVALEPLLVRTLGQGPHARGEALQALASSASPFLGWDEARLRADEQQVLHECVVVGLPQGVSTSASQGLASPLLEGLGEILWAQVIASGDPRRVSALCAVQGLPLAALAGLDEYATAYRATDRASVHALDEWAPTGEPITLDPEDSSDRSAYSSDRSAYSSGWSAYSSGRSPTERVDSTRSSGRSPTEPVDSTRSSGRSPTEPFRGAPEEQFP